MPMIYAYCYNILPVLIIFAHRAGQEPGLSEAWLKHFFLRHPELAPRTASTLASKRNEVSAEDFVTFTNELARYVIQEEVSCLMLLVLYSSLWCLLKCIT